MSEHDPELDAWKRALRGRGRPTDRDCDCSLCRGERRRERYLARKRERARCPVCDRRLGNPLCAMTEEGIW